MADGYQVKAYESADEISNKLLSMGYKEGSRWDWATVMVVRHMSDERPRNNTLK